MLQEIRKGQRAVEDIVLVGIPEIIVQICPQASSHVGILS